MSGLQRVEQRLGDLFLRKETSGQHPCAFSRVRAFTFRTRLEAALSREAPAWPREMTAVRLHQLQLVESQGISAWSVTAFLSAVHPLSAPVGHLHQGDTNSIDLSLQPKKKKKTSEFG